MHWETIIQLALQGTDAGGIPESLSDYLKEKGLDTDHDPVEVLLDGAAMLALERKAGFPLQKISTVIGEVPQESSSPPVDRDLMEMMKEVVSGSMQPVLPELLSLLREGNIEVPPECLPPLLNICLKDSFLWPDLRAVMGETGRWLIRQNPAWIDLLETKDEELWEKGNPAARKAFLRSLRTHIPLKALERLREKWLQLDHSEKFSLLNVLQLELSDADEPFLKEVLGDRRKEVRHKAAVLLLECPGSRWSEKWVLPVFEQLTGTSTRLLEPDPETALYGLVHKDQLHDPDAWAREMVRWIPPAAWRSVLGERHSLFWQLLTRNEDEDQARILNDHLLQAVVLHEDREWAAPVWTHWLFRNHLFSDITNLQLARLLRLVPPAHYYQKMLASVEKAYNSGDLQRNLIIRSLIHKPGFWADQLAHKFLDPIFQFNRSEFDWRAQTTSFRSLYPAFELLLEHGAYKVNPKHLNIYKDAASKFSGSRGFFPLSDLIKNFLAILSFRKEMRYSLSLIANQQKKSK